MHLTLAEVALGCAGRLEAPASISAVGALIATGYSIDSRSILTGELFFAVRGERHDGHAFLAAALDRGAVAAVVSLAQVASLPDSVLACPLVLVEDPLTALQALASHVRRQWGKRVVAITGSAGKTSTKDAIAAALGAGFHVLKSQGNLNNGFGLPLQLLRLQAEHDIAVVEMGMNHAGEIALLARIAAPDWGVVTNVGTAHIQNFSDGQSGIARAKYELVDSLPETGVAFLNCDDAYVGQFGRDFAGKAVYFGFGPCADPQIIALDQSGESGGLQLSIRLGEETYPVHLHLLVRHNASNAAAALAVAHEAGVRIPAAIAALEALEPGDRRGQLLPIGGAILINDCYNSNPEALKSMILALAARPAQRRILVAGEMLELGDHAPQLHAACGEAAAAAGLDIVVGVRGNARRLAEAAAELGTRAVFVADAGEAGQWLLANIRPGDAILVKGSRGVHLEQAIEALQEGQS